MSNTSCNRGEKLFTGTEEKFLKQAIEKKDNLEKVESEDMKSEWEVLRFVEKEGGGSVGDELFTN